MPSWQKVRLRAHGSSESPKELDPETSIAACFGAEIGKAPVSTRFVAAVDQALDARGRLIHVLPAVVYERAMQRQARPDVRGGPARAARTCDWRAARHARSRGAPSAGRRAAARRSPPAAARHGARDRPTVWGTTSTRPYWSGERPSTPSTFATTGRWGWAGPPGAHRGPMGRCLPRVTPEALYRTRTDDPFLTMEVLYQLS
ncbi:MAG: hypothetical protein QOD83_3099 [Solirubrobacteraceae bacterium]|nr:hypothetical protein [Solirubrobacteraceae bacterium]